MNFTEDEVFAVIGHLYMTTMKQQQLIAQQAAVIDQEESDAESAGVSSNGVRPNEQVTGTPTR